MIAYLFGLATIPALAACCWAALKVYDWVVPERASFMKFRDDVDLPGRVWVERKVYRERPPVLVICPSLASRRALAVRWFGRTEPIPPPGESTIKPIQRRVRSEW